ncbi:hypothetical protein SE17_04500 [Kouleothrix aurantiaca]|uniref:AAA+ ATPase domain-containing protein n=1 Tax=Kouleothrix aurantiaca TaxID=186479 RepID=A0A0P9D9A6_9CHLR|nr:hypothetical protein SE17_04500 [Kouleothrix aurantiaca]
MEIKTLRLSQVRGYVQAEFQFRPGMNLLVGINGVGKSTVLDTIRILMSQILPEITATTSKADFFDTEHISIEHKFLTVEMQIETSGVEFEYFVHKQLNEYSSPAQRKSAYKPAHHVGREKRISRRRLDQEGYRRPEFADFYSDSPIPSNFKSKVEQPFAVFYSTRRSLWNRAVSAKTRQNASGQAVAFVEALSINRELSTREFAEWWLTREILADEGDSTAKPLLAALQSAALTFLDDFTSIRAIQDEGGAKLKMAKGNIELDVLQLSDGERGMLTLALDLARRLAQANPNLQDPLREGKAVVLIDELDLHLHPRWQRTIVQKLTETFPACQFIATTHSPLIIGEVQPDGLIFLTNEDGRIVIRQGDQGYGLDSSYILEHLMATNSRATPSRVQINLVEDALEEGDLSQARNHLNELRKMLHGDDDEVIRLDASINNLEALADEVDPEEE